MKQLVEIDDGLGTLGRIIDNPHGLWFEVELLSGEEFLYHAGELTPKEEAGPGLEEYDAVSDEVP